MVSVTGYVPGIGETDPQKLSRSIRNLYEYLTGATFLTSLNGQGGDAIQQLMPSARLTLTSGVPVTTADVSGAAAIYSMPMGANVTPIYDGTNDVPRAVPSSTTLTLTAGNHLAGQGYDVFEAWSGGVYVIGTGPQWSVVTAGSGSRGTGAGTTEVTTFNGRRVNANSITLKNGGSTYTVAVDQANLLGGFIIGPVAGQTEDSMLKRFLWSEYNATWREMQRNDPTAIWNYSSTTPHQANANPANQFAVFNGASGRPVLVEVLGHVTNSTATKRNMAVGIGINISTVNSAITISAANNDNSSSSPTMAKFNGYPAIGYNEFRWLEIGAGSDTQTWTGTFAPAFLSGMTGRTFQ